MKRLYLCLLYFLAECNTAIPCFSRYQHCCIARGGGAPWPWWPAKPDKFMYIIDHAPPYLLMIILMIYRCYTKLFPIFDVTTRFYLHYNSVIFTRAGVFQQTQNSAHILTRPHIVYTVTSRPLSHWDQIYIIYFTHRYISDLGKANPLVMLLESKFLCKQNTKIQYQLNISEYIHIYISSDLIAWLVIANIFGGKNTAITWINFVRYINFTGLFRHSEVYIRPRSIFLQRRRFLFYVFSNVFFKA